MTYTLDNRLADDSVPLTTLPLSELRLINDARFPWLLLIPRRAKLEELVDLSSSDRLALTTEIDRVSRALRTVSHADKLNVAALGNVVSQLHVHVIARKHTDACWPKPVWGQGPAVPYTTAALTELSEQLLTELEAHE
ncbi:MAG: HIT family protein [Pseudomonadota bacterium]